MINVLVVEDDPMVAQLHEHYLSQIKGFQLCDVANNGDAALKLLGKKNYDLLILDIFMPTMDGLQLLAKVREQITAPAQFLAQSERQVDDAAGQRTDCQLDGKEGSGIGAVHTLRFQHLGQGSHMRIKLVGKQQKVNGRANHDESGRADQSCQIITPMAFEAGP